MKKLILIAMAGILLSACSVTTQQQKRLTTVGGCVGGDGERARVCFADVADDVVAVCG